MLSLNSASANCRLFRSAPQTHWVVAGCLPLSVRQGTIMSHWGKGGLGGFPFYKMTTVYSTFRCRKWTRIAILVAACPGYPCARQLRGPPLSGKAMQYVRGSSLVAKFFHLCLSSVARQCCVTSCTVPVPSITPGTRVPLPSSVACMPPPTGSPPPGMGGRPFQLSS